MPSCKNMNRVLFRNILVTSAVVIYLAVMIYLNNPLSEYHGQEYFDKESALKETAAIRGQAAFNAFVEPTSDIVTLDLSEVGELTGTVEDLTSTIEGLQKSVDAQATAQGAYDDAYDKYMDENQYQLDAKSLLEDSGENWAQHSMKSLAVGAGIAGAYQGIKWIFSMRGASNVKGGGVKLFVYGGIMALLLFLAFNLDFTQTQHYNLALGTWITAIAGLGLYVVAKTTTVGFCMNGNLKYNDADSYDHLKINGTHSNTAANFFGRFVNIMEHGNPRKLKNTEVAPVPLRRRLPAMETILTSITF